MALSKKIYSALIGASLFYSSASLHASAWYQKYLPNYVATINQKTFSYISDTALTVPLIIASPLMAYAAYQFLSTESSSLNKLLASTLSSMAFLPTYYGIKFIKYNFSEFAFTQSEKHKKN